MVRSRQKKLVAAVVGVLLAGAPLAAFDVWLDRVIDRQGVEDISGIAQRAVVVIETRLANVVAGLEGLAAQGVASCGSADVEKLRRASFAVSAAKEFSIIGPDGQTICSDLSISLGAKKVVSAPRKAAAGDVLIEVVRLSDRAASYLRVRRFGAGGSSLAALVPADMLMPLTSSHGGPVGAYVRVFASDGQLIGEGGTLIPADVKPSNLLTSTMRSERFGLTVAVTRSNGVADSSDLHTLGRIVNTVTALAVLALALLLGRWLGRDPVGEIRRALDAHEFIPYYQPIVDITSGKLLGAEVLARWRKPDGTVVLPAAFLPQLDRGGLMVELTQSLMRRACEDVGEAYACRRQLKIAFNLTARHFASDAVVADLRAIFERSPINLSQVTLELTEREPIEDLTTTRRVIAALQGLGCQIALDDVGTGHSGLSSILRLGVDVIKIDKMFIDSLGSERNSATIVTTMVELARNMRMDVVAEGVENFEQVADLRARGIRAAQGYVFAPPLPGSSFLTLLEALDPTAAQPASEAGSRGHRAA